MMTSGVRRAAQNTNKVEISTAMKFEATHLASRSGVGHETAPPSDNVTAYHISAQSGNVAELWYGMVW